MIPAKTGIPTTKWSPHAQWAVALCSSTDSQSLPKDVAAAFLTQIGIPVTLHIAMIFNLYAAAGRACCLCCNTPSAALVGNLL
jgi:hypothetical protein